MPSFHQQPSSPHLGQLHLHSRLHSQHPPSRLSLRGSNPLRLRLRQAIPRPRLPPLAFSSSSSCGGGGNNNYNNNGRGDDGKAGDGDGGWSNRDRVGELFMLAQAGKKLSSMPSDLAAAVEAGRVTGDVVRRFAEMEASSPLLRWLLSFVGFRERLLADDSFLAKLALEVGAVMIMKIAEEYEKRKENFVKEINIVIAYVVMVVATKFLLVYLPASTISLQPSLGINATASLFHNFFQTAGVLILYLFLVELQKIVRVDPKVFTVGTSASLDGTGVTDALITKELDDKVEDIPVEATPDKIVDKKWSSCFKAGAELSAETRSVAASVSFYSSGESREQGKA